MRSYASKGAVDLLAVRRRSQDESPGLSGTANMPPEVWMVQAKKHGRIDPAERITLVDLARAHGALAVMAYGVRPTKYKLVTYDGKGEHLDP
jgi:hypothetical protein